MTLTLTLSSASCRGSHSLPRVSAYSEQSIKWKVIQPSALTTGAPIYPHMLQSRNLPIHLRQAVADSLKAGACDGCSGGCKASTGAQGMAALQAYDDTSLSCEPAPQQPLLPSGAGCVWWRDSRPRSCGNTVAPDSWPLPFAADSELPVDLAPCCGVGSAVAGRVAAPGTGATSVARSGPPARSQRRVE